jgi:hypothetical protein
MTLQDHDGSYLCPIIPRKLEERVQDWKSKVPIIVDIEGGPTMIIEHLYYISSCKNSGSL